MTRIILLLLFFFFQCGHSHATSTLRHNFICDEDNATHCADVTYNSVSTYLKDGQTGGFIGTTLQPDGDYSVNVERNQNRLTGINRQFSQLNGVSSSLTSAASVGDYTINVANGALFAAGNNITISEGAIEETKSITLTNVAGNTLTLDRLLENDYTTASLAEKVTINMAVNGSMAAPQVFEVAPVSGEVYVITNITITMYDNTAMDIAKFGGLTALTNGLLIRLENHIFRNYANWKDNADISLDTHNITYSDPAPAGFYGLNAIWNFTDNSTWAIRLVGSDGDKLKAYIHDDLTGASRISLEAHGYLE